MTELPVLSADYRAERLIDAALQHPDLIEALKYRGRLDEPWEERKCGMTFTEVHQESARNTCADCPARIRCLADALSNGLESEFDHVRGGYTTARRYWLHRAWERAVAALTAPGDTP